MQISTISCAVLATVGKPYSITNYYCPKSKLFPVRAMTVAAEKRYSTLNDNSG